MKIKRLIVKDLLSIADIDIEFQDTGLFLLDGWNYDDDTANGAGKSSVWNSLSFALYGKLPRKITSTEIVRRECKRGYAIAYVDINGKELIIKRSRPKKEEFTLDGKPVNSQEELESILDLTYQQFLVSMYVSQSGDVKFINLNDSSKKDFFLNILNLDDFDSVKSHTDKIIKVLESKQLEINSEISTLNTKISTSEEMLEDDEEIKTKISNLDTKDLKVKLKNIDTTQPDLFQLNTLETKLFNALNDVSGEISKVSVSRESLSDLDSQIKQLSEEVDSIGHTIECPHCSEDFVMVGSSTLTKEQLLEKIEKKKLKLQSKRKTLVDIINSESTLLSKKKDIKEAISKSQIKKKEVSATYMENRERFSELKSLIDKRESAIEFLNDKLDRNKTIKDNIAKHQKRISKLREEKKEVDTSLEVHKTLVSFFAPTGAPAYLLDSAIDVFNEKVSHYISYIWPNASYTLLSYKENKTGGIKAKLSDSLVIGGNNVSLGSLSGGELRCLSLSIDFAILDTIEALMGKKINPYILDEPFEGLDASNREKAIEMLDNLANTRQVWVIDHQSESRALFSDIMRVEKRNGVSAILGV